MPKEEIKQNVKTIPIVNMLKNLMYIDKNKHYKTGTLIFILNMFSGFIISFVFSGGLILTSLTFFGYLYVTASVLQNNKLESVFSFVGMFLGYFLSNNSYNKLYAIAGVLVYVISIIVSFINNDKFKKIYLTYINPGLYLVFASFAYMAKKEFNAVAVIYLSFNAILVIIATPLIMKFCENINIKSDYNKTKEFILQNKNVIYLMGMVFLLGLYSINIGEFNMGITASYILILILSYKNKISKSIIISFILGITSIICLSGNIYLFAVMMISGIISGLLSRFGKIHAAFGFCVCAFIISLIGNAFFSSYAGVFEIITGGIIFVVLPVKLISKIKSYIEFNIMLEDNITEKRTYNSAAERFRAIAGVFDNLAHEINCSEFISGESRNKEDISALFIKAMEKPCRNCRNNNNCWEKNYNNTMDMINNLCSVIEINGMLIKNDFPAHFECMLKETLCERINAQYKHFIVNREQKNKVRENRVLLSGQYENIAKLIEVSADMTGVRFDNKSESAAKRALQKYGFENSSVCIYIDKNDRYTCEIETGYIGHLKTSNEEIIKICEDVVRDAVGIKMVKEITSLPQEFNKKMASGSDILYHDLPMAKSNKEGFYIKLSESVKFSLEYSAAQLAKSGEKVCGDSLMIIKTAGAKQFVGISDGMGSGEGAAKISKNALEITRDLINAGTSSADTMSMLNTSLLLKNEQENFATLDGIVIDLYSGSAEFMKAGAATSFILRGDRLFEYSVSSVPCGLISNMKYETAKCRLRNKDIIIMFSDGVIDQCTDSVRGYLKALDYTDLEESARRIIKFAHKLNNTHADDMSVIICRVCEIFN